MPARPPGCGKHRTRRGSANISHRETLHSRLQFSHVIGEIVPQIIRGCMRYLYNSISYRRSVLILPHFATTLFEPAGVLGNDPETRLRIVKKMRVRRRSREKIVPRRHPGTSHPRSPHERCLKKIHRIPASTGGAPKTGGGAVDAFSRKIP
mgnify:CR=1 FL=1